MPVAAPTVAFAVADEVHTPPASPDALLRAAVAVGQTVKVPVIAPALGSGFTVTTLVAAAVPQLLVTVYDIVDVPASTPVTMPDEAPIVAVAVLNDVQTPPASPPEDTRDVVTVGQTTALPVIIPTSGNGLTDMALTTVIVPQAFVFA